MTTLHSSFVDFPDEVAILGRLVFAFPQLELDLMNCVVDARHLDEVLRAMFGQQSTKGRIKQAKTIGKAYYSKLGLEDEFTTAVAAVKECSHIRHQVAHSYWFVRNKRVAFVAIEELASSPKQISDLGNLTFKYVDLPLLERQEAYFAFTSNLLIWVNYEGRKKSGKLSKNHIRRPKAMNPPQLCIP